MDLEFGQHQFLKKDTSCPLNSTAIERIIARGLKQNIRNEIAIEPFLSMVNFESENFSPDVDPTRACLAFGDRAIPKIKRELLSKDKTIAKRALSSLLDVVHDPEQAVEALRLQIIPRLVRLLSSDDVFVRQHVLMVLQVLSMQPGAKLTIVKNQPIMSSLSVLMMDSDRNVRLNAAKTLLALAAWYFGVEELIKDYYVYLVINQLEIELDNDIAVALMQTLILLLDHSNEAKYQAMTHRAIELSVYLDHTEAQLRALGCELVAQLARLPEGKEEIVLHRCDILAKLTCLLDDENEEVQNHSAEALMFVLVSKSIKNHCLKNLPIMCKLLRCAQYFRAPGLQMNALKGLTCLAEHPQAREFLVHKINEIEAIRVANQLVDSHKKILLTTIRTVI
ncbi:radial spoke head 14 homolog [Macrosteles quadrilineatus]|uniref:radial spoke head 14 homolog n=1 Tax=Macrosteles quadrilineatus TaxID=74068 RepID=UPI0023E20009|nr:radial spoke head 14 homolog [Macrosteles quadrilineatus]